MALRYDGSKTRRRKLPTPNQGSSSLAKDKKETCSRRIRQLEEVLKQLQITQDQSLLRNKALLEDLQKAKQSKATWQSNEKDFLEVKKRFNDHVRKIYPTFTAPMHRSTPVKSNGHPTRMADAAQGDVPTRGGCPIEKSKEKDISSSFHNGSPSPGMVLPISLGAESFLSSHQRVANVGDQSAAGSTEDLKVIPQVLALSPTGQLVLLPMTFSLPFQNNSTITSPLLQGTPTSSEQSGVVAQLSDKISHMQYLNGSPCDKGIGRPEQVLHYRNVSQQNVSSGKIQKQCADTDANVALDSKPPTTEPRDFALQNGVDRQLFYASDSTDVRLRPHGSASEVNCSKDTLEKYVKVDGGGIKIANTSTGLPNETEQNGHNLDEDNERFHDFSDHLADSVSFGTSEALSDHLQNAASNELIVDDLDSKTDDVNVVEKLEKDHKLRRNGIPIDLTVDHSYDNRPKLISNGDAAVVNSNALSNNSASNASLPRSSYGDKPDKISLVSEVANRDHTKKIDYIAIVEDLNIYDGLLGDGELSDEGSMFSDGSLPLSELSNPKSKEPTRTDIPIEPQHTTAIVEKSGKTFAESIDLDCLLKLFDSVELFVEHGSSNLSLLYNGQGDSKLNNDILSVIQNDGVIEDFRMEDVCCALELAVKSYVQSMCPSGITRPGVDVSSLVNAGDVWPSIHPAVQQLWNKMISHGQYIAQTSEHVVPRMAFILCQSLTISSTDALASKLEEIMIKALQQMVDDAEMDMSDGSFHDYEDVQPAVIPFPAVMNENNMITEELRLSLDLRSVSPAESSLSSFDSENINTSPRRSRESITEKQGHLSNNKKAINASDHITRQLPQENSAYDRLKLSTPDIEAYDDHSDDDIEDLLGSSLGTLQSSQGANNFKFQNTDDDVKRTRSPPTSLASPTGPVSADSQDRNRHRQSSNNDRISEKDVQSAEETSQPLLTKLPIKSKGLEPGFWEDSDSEPDIGALSLPSERDGKNTNNDEDFDFDFFQ